MDSIPEAYYELFAFYYNGEVVEKNYCQAFEWLRKIEDVDEPFFAKTGTPFGFYFFTLGSLYIHGIGTLQNIQKGVNCYKKSSLYEYHQAEYEIGLLAYNSQDYKNAELWYTQAAKGGYMYAQHNLALLLLEMNRTVDAYCWLKEAYENGDEEVASIIEDIKLQYPKIDEILN